jgi:hypothetical protein
MVLKRTKQKHFCFSGLSSLRLKIFVFILFVTSISGCQTAGIQYRHIVRNDPRPLHIHVAKVDLHNSNLKLHLEVAELPGEGEGTAVLTDPYTLAKRGDFQIAINSNSWEMVDGTKDYLEGRAAYHLGWILADGICRSEPSGRCSFWLDSEGKPHIGNISSPVEGAILGIEGHSNPAELIGEGKILPQEGGEKNPRTALGLDKYKRYLTMVVVDGRMPGYSEGVTARELAFLMEELGCWDALNLDGGGSSIMLERSDGGFIRKNKGVNGYVRPLPTLFGAQKTQASYEHQR